MPQQVTAIPYFTLLKGAPFKVREPYRYPPPSPFAFGSPNSSNNLVYSEFYCDPVLGNNMNGGSDQNASPSYSTTNGNWNGSSTFIPTDGSNPYFTVTPGQFASVFIDGATTPVYLARVLSAQNAVNGAIVLSTGSAVGTAPTSSATARSINVGGVFKGPNGTVGFPMALINFQG